MTASIKSAIADPIAALFAGVTVNGQTWVLGPTTDLPNAIDGTPAGLLFPPADFPVSWDVGPGRATITDAEFHFVTFLPAKDFLKKRVAALWAWFDALLWVPAKSFGLGFSTAGAQMVMCRLVNASPELAGAQYAGITFDVVDLELAVTATILVSGTAP